VEAKAECEEAVRVGGLVHGAVPGVVAAAASALRCREVDPDVRDVGPTVELSTAGDFVVVGRWRDHHGPMEVE
jgi:hypothetical protein